MKKIKNMKPEKKGQFIGGIIGLVLGSLIAYIIWGFSSPGGIIILLFFSIGSMIGWNVKKKSGCVP